MRRIRVRSKTRQSQDADKSITIKQIKTGILTKTFEQ